MSNYFEKIERIMREKGITELDMWNIDKTGFRIRCGKAKLVVTIDANKLLSMIDLENCDDITSVGCIDSVCETIPPILLISRVKVLHK